MQGWYGAPPSAARSRSSQESPVPAAAFAAGTGMVLRWVLAWRRMALEGTAGARGTSE